MYSLCKLRVYIVFYVYIIKVYLEDRYKLNIKEKVMERELRYVLQVEEGD